MVRQLCGAALLAIGRRRGAEAFGGTMPEALFGLAVLAAALVAPDLLASGGCEGEACLPPDDSPLFWVAVTLLNLAANVLVSRVIAGWLGLRDRWPHYIAAWAWLHAVATLLLLPVVGALDTLTLDGADTLALLLAVAGVALVSWIGWFAAVAVLGARPWAAVGLVVADLAVITAISAAAHFPLAA